VGASALAQEPPGDRAAPLAAAKPPPPHISIAESDLRRKKIPVTPYGCRRRRVTSVRVASRRSIAWLLVSTSARKSTITALLARLEDVSQQDRRQARAVATRLQ